MATQHGRAVRTQSRGRRKDLVLGIDLGATKVVSGLVAPDGTIVRHSGRQVHANDGPGGVIRAVARSALACLGDDYPVPPRIGIAVAAQVDPRTGTVVHAPNLGWRDVALAHRLHDVLNAPIVVVNDARAAAFAEWKHGAGVGTSDMFLLTLGTGVGGSAVVGGRLLEGGSHACGEIGHITIVVGGRKCHCPNWGCFEAYVGGWAIAERAREAVRSDPTGGAYLLERAGSAELITAQTVFQAYRNGDPLSGRLVRDTERFLADGAVSVVNAFNPSVLVMAGGLVAGMPGFIPVVESAIRARCQPPAAGARVVPAELGEDAALVGAACVARTQPSRR
ncbi:MAG TPA: ROK family protein [Thermoplasmata archaeon]|jgi:glucokinase|nr:ROK family protein [Thermoplasmata archaeon]